MQSRTHTCGELRITDAGKKVQLSGWMENFREVGAELGFVVIRDFYGTTQIVIETAEMMKTFKAITKESTISRPSSTVDIDVFFPDITDGQSFLAFVDHDASLSPLKLELLRGAEVVQTYFGGDHLYIQEINVYNTNEAPIYLRVSGLHDSDANRYHLKLESFERVEGVDLAVDNLTIESGALSASEAKEVTLDIHNLGSQNAESFTIGYYISQTSEIDESAWRISRQTIAGLNGNTTTSQSISLILPTDMAGGAYHLIARVDDGSEIDDVRPQNNTIRSPEWIFARSCWDVLDPNESLETAHEITFSDNAFDRLAQTLSPPPVSVISRSVIRIFFICRSCSVRKV